MNTTPWDDYGEEPHEGWTQVGDIYGRKYSCWIRNIDGHRCVINRGNDQWTGELGPYWL